MPRTKRSVPTVMLSDHPGKVREQRKEKLKKQQKRETRRQERQDKKEAASAEDNDEEEEEVKGFRCVVPSCRYSGQLLPFSRHASAECLSFHFPANHKYQICLHCYETISRKEDEHCDTCGRYNLLDNKAPPSLAFGEEEECLLICWHCIKEKKEREAESALRVTVRIGFKCDAYGCSKGSAFQPFGNQVNGPALEDHLPANSGYKFCQPCFARRLLKQDERCVECHAVDLLGPRAPKKFAFGKNEQGEPLCWSCVAAFKVGVFICEGHHCPLGGLTQIKTSMASPDHYPSSYNGANATVCQLCIDNSAKCSVPSCKLHDAFGELAPLQLRFAYLDGQAFCPAHFKQMTE
jgi:hypothetical protein